MAKGGNVLVMQSGGSTAVLNRSLVGIVHETQAHDAFGEIFGARHALEGVLEGEIINLGHKSKAWWQRVARTPGAVLGSSRRSLRTEDIATVLKRLSDYDIRYWFIIGGNDSAETGHRIAAAMRDAGRPLTVVNVPKTIDNDLVATDHSPGYGSAARFVALATMGAGRDAETMGKAAPIAILEVMGRDAGWLAASAALGKGDEGDAPHVICVPEVPVDEQRFLDQMEDAYRRFGFAVAVVAENVRGPHGVLGGDQEPWYVDDFGHAYYRSPAEYLATRAARRLRTRVRIERPGTIQRSLVSCISGTDAQEAEMAGQAAVRYALQGVTDQMVTLIRDEGERYTCSTGTAPLEQVAGQVKRMPDAYLDTSRSMVTPAFIRYAMPLIGGPLRRFARLP